MIAPLLLVVTTLAAAEPAAGTPLAPGLLPSSPEASPAAPSAGDDTSTGDDTIAGDLVDGVVDTASGAAADTTSDAALDIAPGRALLRMRGGQAPEALDGVRPLRALRFGWHAVVLEGALDEAATLARIAGLRADPRVDGAEPDRRVRPLLRPDDPYLAHQWPLHRLGLEAAWDVTQGGAAQRIGVVDTGARASHTDLRGRDGGGWDFISDADAAGDGDGRDADFSDPGLPTSCDGEELSLLTHGTHVSAILLGNAEDGAGIAGVNWRAHLVSARAMNACGGVESDLLDALAWLGGWPVEGAPRLDAPVDVINLSLGTRGGCSTPMREHVRALREERNVVLVAATGNDGNEQGPLAPAACDDVIAVAAHGPGAARPLADYANFNGRVDVVAPGGDLAGGLEGGILSACGEADDCWQFAQGTSMAAPWVAGAVSLLLAAHPDLDRGALVELLRESGEPCEGCGDVPALRIDAALALAAAEPALPFEPPAHGCPGAPCGPQGRCGDGERCITDDGELCCVATCEPGAPAACPEGQRCLATQGGGLCFPAGTRVEGAACADDPDACALGLVCGTLEGQQLCLRTCGAAGGVCRSVEQTCTEAGDVSVCLPVLDEETAATQERCDPARGHWDCPEGWGCVSPDDGSLAVCVLGAAGVVPAGGRCGDAAECASGLCDLGVCAVPCTADESCHPGATCDAEAIPGGLCRPQACDDDASCPAGWTCTDVEAQRLCVAGGCSCRTSPARGGADGAPLDGVLALGLALGLARLLARSRRQRAGRTTAASRAGSPTSTGREINAHESRSPPRGLEGGPSGR